MHTFSNHILLNDRINDYLTQLDNASSSTASIVSGIAQDAVTVFGRLEVTVTDTTDGRHAINAVLDAYNARVEHEEPVVFANTGARRIDSLSLYHHVDSQNNHDVQTHELGRILDVAPLEPNATVTIPGYIRNAHGRVIQQENGNGTLRFSFPLLLNKTDVTPILAILCHLLDTNAGDTLLAIEWNARDTSHPMCAEYACFSRGMYLKDLDGWHMDRFDTAHETPNDY